MKIPNLMQIGILKFRTRTYLHAHRTNKAQLGPNILAQSL